jgi:hypothetical protein
MAKIITETPTFTSAITVPEAGDSAAAGVIETAYQGLANRTKYLYDQDAASDAEIAALKAQSNRGQWIIKSANDIWVGTRHVASSADGWAPTGIGGNNEVALGLTATGAYSTMEVSFGVPSVAGGLEWAIWFAENLTPATRAKFSGEMVMSTGSALVYTAIASTTVPASGGYASYAIASPGTPDLPGMFRMLITSSSSAASSFILLGAGVRFHDGALL